MCRLFKEQLEEQFPEGDFRVKSFQHDFGTYLEVVAYYDTDMDDDRMKVAFEAESDAYESSKKTRR